ncbi:SixA phosphatase family protein [Rhodospirillum centenum]|uniref:Phosphohistidine phosphatase SixA, putative n=1 Tax=Rhodospirillum centenum (strain ATCC 51521 / SW) TaxID=414684 RepID=B6IN51_RHOCS|nr:histidine phosphatase family protein [Rhodospirillum centenum]ACI98948.1 phosphohistidine phosphatase SixA, putative [Rhodospirillum centenum SW]
MKSLYLLRHAKSAWDDATLEDHDRPLAPRGRRACATMAKYLGERKGGPPRLDLVLCSTARRARETLEGVLPAWPVAPETVHEAGLYLCGTDALLDRLRALPETVGAVMLVGHNPDFQELALTLAGTGDPAALAAVREKLPTGGFIALELPDGPWSGLSPRGGRLVEFTPPRSLTGPLE